MGSFRTARKPFDCQQKTVQHLAFLRHLCLPSYCIREYKYHTENDEVNGLPQTYDFPSRIFPSRKVALGESRLQMYRNQINLYIIDYVLFSTDSEKKCINDLRH